MGKNVILKDCSDEFADLIYDLDSAYRSRVKLGISINFSGNLSDFRCTIDPSSIERKKFFEMLKKESSEKR